MPAIGCTCNKSETKKTKGPGKLSALQETLKVLGKRQFCQRGHTVLVSTSQPAPCAAVGLSTRRTLFSKPAPALAACGCLWL